MMGWGEPPATPTGTTGEVNAAAYALRQAGADALLRCPTLAALGLSAADVILDRNRRIAALEARLAAVADAADAYLAGR